MAKSEDNSFVHDVTTDAQFRAWGLAVRTAITGSGIVRTSDTGQIDFASVTAPAINTYGGYDIFRFDDAEQGSDPIFFKLRYGKSSSTARPALELTVGTGSDGAGTISNASGTTTMNTGATPTPNGLIYATFYDGAFMFFDCVLPGGTASTAAQNTMCFLIERGRDPETKALVSGMILVANPSSTFVGGSARLAGAWSTNAMTKLEQGAKSGNKIRLGGFFCMTHAAAVLQGLLAVGHSDVALGDSGDIAVPPGTRTYKRLPVINLGINLGSSSASAFVVRT